MRRRRSAATRRRRRAASSPAASTRDGSKSSAWTAADRHGELSRSMRARVAAPPASRGRGRRRAPHRRLRLRRRDPRALRARPLGASPERSSPSIRAHASSPIATPPGCTPNQEEVEPAVGLSGAPDERAVVAAGARALERTGNRTALVTRGAKGHDPLPQGRAAARDAAVRHRRSRRRHRSRRHRHRDLHAGPDLAAPRPKKPPCSPTPPPASSS